MGQVIPFPRQGEEVHDLDLLTAVDVAIRDLRDVLLYWGQDSAREQADECRKMLEQVFDTHCAEIGLIP